MVSVIGSDVLLKHRQCRPDATLREIADLVQDSNTEAQKPNMRLSICVVSETRDGR